MTTTQSTPEPFSPSTAEITSTSIMMLGIHPVTGKLDFMGASSDAEIRKDVVAVFDLNRKTGEWVKRA